MFRSFGRSWQLVKASWAVLQADKELVVFPIISAVLMVVVSITFLLPVGVIFGLLGAGEGSSDVIGYLLMFFWYLATYTVGTYFNVSLVGAALIRLDGGDPTVGDGFRIANERIDKILGFAAISATVGVLLQMLEENGFIGQIVSSVIGIAWSLATFLVVPILVTRDVGPIDAVKQSGAMLKSTWGEQITGNFSLGGVFFLIYLLVIALGIGLFMVTLSVFDVAALSAIVIALMVIAIIVLAVIQGALGGIFQAALYRYAEEGVAPDQFDIDLIQGAFKPKRKR